VFCLIHDLEVLLLAAEESLLADRQLPEPTWIKPVEEQNHGNPPKRVAERLFGRYDSQAALRDLAVIRSRARIRPIRELSRVIGLILERTIGPIGPMGRIGPMGAPQQSP